MSVSGRRAIRSPALLTRMSSAPEPLDAGLDRPARDARGREIALDQLRLAPGRTHVARGLLRAVAALPEVDRDVRAAARELDRAGPADARPRARDERDLALE